MNHVVVVGSANADLVLDVDHRPAAGETVLGSDLVVTAGGKGANQAVAAGRLGGDVTFLGCLGDDEHGQVLRASLVGAGVDTSRVHTVDAPTGTAVIILTPDGENSIIVSPGANAGLTPDRIEEDAVAGAGVVVLQLEIPLETVARAAGLAANAGARVVLNAAPAAHLPAGVLAVADPLVVNESEAAFLLGDGADGDPGDVAAALLALGPRSVVLTLGAQGSVYADGATAGRVAAERVEAVDTTGAGDGFVGALAVELAGGADLPAAIEVATRVAAIAVGRRGAQESYPTRAELTPAG